MEKLINEIQNCNLCKNHLALGPRPIFTVHPKSKIIIIGQAPGSVVHNTGIPWNDISGKNLRSWMGINNKEFYDSQKIAILPMGFCYPGKGKSGDLPPRKECAPLWHDILFNKLEEVELILLIGKYAQDYYLKSKVKKTVTETDKNVKEYLPKYFVLPHTSPRNNIWQAKNKWFTRLVIPELQKEIKQILG